MLDKYIKINEKQIICGQTSSGVWYCKELPANTTAELRVMIGEVNDIFNSYNTDDKVDKNQKKIVKTG